MNVDKDKEPRVDVDENAKKPSINELCTLPPLNDDTCRASRDIEFDPKIMDDP